MKLQFSRLLLLLGLSLSLSSCMKDDMEGPNAQVYGIIKDKVTGEPVQTELINGSIIQAFEQGYATPVAQNWLIKNTGEYRNNLVFANKYNFNLINGNFIPVSITDYEIKPGENKLDFEVEPYIRVKNCAISKNSNNQVVATFNLEPGVAAARLSAIRLYAFSDVYVGEAVKFNTAGTSFQQSFGTPIVINPATTYTLTIDLNTNATLFPAGRDYFFRVGALASISGYGTVRRNYASFVKISL
jgi:hypothetical protein